MGENVRSDESGDKPDTYGVWNEARAALVEATSLLESTQRMLRLREGNLRDAQDHEQSAWEAVCRERQKLTS